MGVYKYIRDAWKKPKENLKELQKERLIEWRKEPVTMRIGRPTRLDRARSLGYKAKQGIILVRQRVSKTKRMRPSDRAGRRPKAYRFKKITQMNYGQIAEQRANQKYPNCEVLNSYEVARDGKSVWQEIILVDRNHPATLANEKLNWISLERGRAFRGKTSHGRKSRGLRNKGKGAEKIRPGLKANGNRAK